MDYEIALALRHTEIWASHSCTIGQERMLLDVSTAGRRKITNLKTGASLTLDYKSNRRGYHDFWDTTHMHRLIAQVFVPGNGKPHVNHKDRNRANNNINNLEWVTLSGNRRTVNFWRHKACHWRHKGLHWIANPLHLSYLYVAVDHDRLLRLETYTDEVSTYKTDKPQPTSVDGKVEPKFETPEPTLRVLSTAELEAEAERDKQKREWKEMNARLIRESKQKDLANRKAMLEYRKKNP